MVTLENIEQKTIPFDQFRYKWRFTEIEYNVLPPIHLEQIRPLNKDVARLLMEVTIGSGRFDNWPAGSLDFNHVEMIEIPQGDTAETLIKKWLYQRGLPFEQKVFASWDNDSAALTTWKMIVKYWSDFYYSVSDDLIVIDKTFTWALLFYHKDIIVFGTDRERNNSEICENEL